MCVFMLPGRQLLVLQTVCCSSGPAQAIPPGSGSRRTVLFRMDNPPPHVVLHSLQGDHSLNKHPAEREDEDGGIEKQRQKQLSVN